jgi:hypothetical protein
VATGKSLAVLALASASVLALSAYLANRPAPSGSVQGEPARTETALDQSRSATSPAAPKADRRRPATSSAQPSATTPASSQPSDRAEPATPEAPRPAPIPNVDSSASATTASPANAIAVTPPVPAAGADAPRPTEPKPVETKSADSKVIEIKKDAVIGIHLDQTLTSDTARVDDRITARVARDVVVDGRTAIPAGARLEGVVTLVERNQTSGRGKLGIRFATLVLGDNTRIASQTDTIVRESDPVGEPSASLGASAALGAMLSGGAKPGARAQTNGRGPVPSPGPYKQDARIPSGSLLTLKLTAALSLAPNR